MSDQHYLMTEEQVLELMELDLPFCPTAFQYCKGRFGLYKNYMRLASFRAFGFKDGALLEADMKKNWKGRAFDD